MGDLREMHRHWLWTDKEQKWCKVPQDGQTKFLEAEMSDTINPQHYKGAGGLEVIDVIEAFGLQDDYCLASAIKYILRAGKKGGSPLKQDVEKAIWFLQRRCSQLGSNFEERWVGNTFVTNSPARPQPTPAQTEHLADGIESGRE